MSITNALEYFREYRDLMQMAAEFDKEHGKDYTPSEEVKAIKQTAVRYFDKMLEEVNRKPYKPEGVAIA